MTYIDFEKLEALLAEDFLTKKPYPWLNPQGLIRAEGFAELVEHTPNVSMLHKEFDRPRKHGQRPHDRWRLRYQQGLALHPSWQQFIDELHSRRYRAFIEKIFGTTDLEIGMQWQYAVGGCSVSPHCDGRRKVGSHLFYFNTEKDWDLAWGGQTIMLWDEKIRNPDSAPEVEEFANKRPVNTLGNWSFLFARRDDSWHAVEELASPVGVVRKLFTVNINIRPPLLSRIAGRARRFVTGAPPESYE